MITSKLLVTSFKFAVCSGLLMLFSLVSTAPVQGQMDPDNRPPTEDLLPETTVSFVQVDDFRDMVEKLRETSLGQFFEEDSVAALRDGLLEEARTTYDELKGELAPDVDDLAELPSGEMTFAVIAPRRKDPEFMLILDLDDQTDAMDRVLDAGRAFVEDKTEQEITSEESDDGIKYESFNVDSKRVKFFRRGGLIVGSTSESELDAFVDRWAGREVEKVRPLSSNRKFITIMNRCRGNNELRPEARFYVDPIALAKSSNRGNATAQIALNFLPSLGLDGLLGIGGSMLLDEEDFEGVMHAHVLLADPRTGIFEMTALKPTDYEPESWMPDDTTSYLTTSWDMDQMLAEFTKMVESFQGEGVVDEWIEKNINEESGINFKDDFLAHLTGRITYCQWLEEPFKINSQNNVIAMEISNLEEFEKSFEAIVERLNQNPKRDSYQLEDSERAAEKAGDKGEGKGGVKKLGSAQTKVVPRIEVTEYNGVRIWSQPLETVQRQISERKKRFAKRRQKANGDEEERKSFTELTYEDRLVQQQSFALVGNYLIISPQGKKFIEHAIDTEQSESTPLFDDPKFRTISDKVTKLLKSDLPCAMMYANPEDSFRMMFELYKSDSTQAIISRVIDDRDFLQGFKGRLEENPLPEFDDIKKYIKPYGGYAQMDQTGYHFLWFMLRADEEE